MPEVLRCLCNPQIAMCLCSTCGTERVLWSVGLRLRYTRSPHSVGHRGCGSGRATHALHPSHLPSQHIICPHRPVLAPPFNPALPCPVLAPPLNPALPCPGPPPQSKSAKKSKFSLGVYDPKLGSAISETLSIQVVANEKVCLCGCVFVFIFILRSTYTDFLSIYELIP